MVTNADKQVRLTLEDCLWNQQQLKEILKDLIRNNRPLNHGEKHDFFSMIPKALLSQGTIEPVSLVIQGGWFTFASVQNMAHRLADLHSSRVSLHTFRPEVVDVIVDIGVLWDFLYNRCLFLFPLASAEAVHISAETVERPRQGSYEFSSRGGLEHD
jgi:hypothetical protein